MKGAINKNSNVRRSRDLSRMVTNSDDEESNEIFTEMRSQTPKLRVGILADIQYAPIEDGYSYSGVPRYYKHALSTAKLASQHFEDEKVDCVINLGDTIDGKCLDVPGGGSRALEDVLEALEGYKGPILHTYGNHELYSLSRKELAEKLNVPFVTEEDGSCKDLVGYWSYALAGIRFVIIDSYDISLLDRSETNSSKRKEAEEVLSMHNPNFPEAENSPNGLDGLNKRYVGFNGGVGSKQLQWLQDTLSQSRKNNEKVILLSHQPILPGSSSPVCLIWNYQDVLNTIQPYHDTILACFSGHAHKGGYKRDDEGSGIHFRVIEAVLETNAPMDTYAFMEVYEDRIVIEGFGECASAVYDLGHVGRGGSGGDDDDEVIGDYEYNVSSRIIA